MPQPTTNGPSALVVDDEAALRELVSESLVSEGFGVHSASTSARALELARAIPPDLVVLDLGLPDGNGIDLLIELRKTTDAPVIIVSGRDSEADRVLGLEMGADDYVTKPFSPRELAARARAVRRRGRLNHNQTLHRFGELEVDSGPREVRVNGEPVELTAREFDLLVFLASSPRQVFSPEQILRAVWGSDPEWQSVNTVSEHVYRLRRKLGTEPDRWIVTVRGAGYRFDP